MAWFGRAVRDSRSVRCSPLTDSEIAELLYAGMSDHADGAPLFLDVPEINGAAMALAAAHHLTEVFGCARMTMGPPPHISWLEVFVVTTFELG